MDDARRIYYQLTGAGLTALEAELTRYRGVVSVAEGRLAQWPLTLRADATGRGMRCWCGCIRSLSLSGFIAGMAQTFHDLCQERESTRRGLFGFVVWIFCETLMGLVKENATHMP